MLCVRCVCVFSMRMCVGRVFDGGGGAFTSAALAAQILLYITYVYNNGIRSFVICGLNASAAYYSYTLFSVDARELTRGSIDFEYYLYCIVHNTECLHVWAQWIWVWGLMHKVARRQKSIRIAHACTLHLQRRVRVFYLKARRATVD